MKHFYFVLMLKSHDANLKIMTLKENKIFFFNQNTHIYYCFSCKHSLINLVKRDIILINF